MDQSQTIAELIEALKSPDNEDERRRIMDSLVSIGEPAVAALLKVLNGDRRFVDKRGAAAITLGDIGGAIAFNTLAQILNDETDSSHVRFGAAIGLSRTKNPDAVSVLIDRLDDSSEHVQHGVMLVLGDTGDGRAYEPLMAILQSDKTQCHSTAASALGNLRDVRAVEPLLSALQDDNCLVRSSAAGALGEIGDPRAVEPLIAFLQSRRQFDNSHESHFEKICAITALKALGDERAKDVLIAAQIDAQKQNDISIQRVSRDALKQFGYYNPNLDPDAKL